MASLPSHALIGLGLYRLAEGRAPASQAGLKASLILSCLPDADALFMTWIPYEHPLGHRGFTHSLCFAVLAGLVAARLLKGLTGFRPLPLALLLAAVTASHGLLDAMTDGGLGIAFFCPFDNTRYFLPWDPIPVSPLGGGGILSPYMLRVIGWEALLLWPLALWMGTVRSKAPAWLKVVSWILLAASVWAWRIRL